jgi:hypothetical protein
MELLLPALVLFLLAFTGLSIGIIFGRKGPSGSCSGGTTSNLIDMDCLCGASDTCTVESCDQAIAVTAVCASGDNKKYQQMVAEFEKKIKGSSTAQ